MAFDRYTDQARRDDLRMKLQPAGDLRGESKGESDTLLQRLNLVH